MISVDPITNGLVIDHIQAGRSMDIYKYLNLAEIENPIAIMRNVKSTKYGKKDIIKIEGLLDIDFDVLGFVDPNITVAVIRNQKVEEKLKLELPKEIKNVKRCKNPRCITSTEDYIDQVFYLSDEEHKVYRCAYCHQIDK